ncbi:hypothetical protein B0H13DRAFT_1867365 [Mycena leptocephala]|nr:hypothetical protein B0H13DRAFT_1867365 [Mycena leptocephala]
MFVLYECGPREEPASENILDAEEVREYRVSYELGGNESISRTQSTRNTARGPVMHEKERMAVRKCVTVVTRTGIRNGDKRKTRAAQFDSTLSVARPPWRSRAWKSQIGSRLRGSWRLGIIVRRISAARRLDWVVSHSCNPHSGVHYGNPADVSTCRRQDEKKYENGKVKDSAYARQSGTNG